MLKRFLRSTLLAGACLSAAVGLSPAESEAAGLLSPKNGNSPTLAIRDHIVGVVIEDGYAITTIEQVFQNSNRTDLEAVYSFPVPEKAAVSEFTYWIDGQPVTGEVRPKEEARQIYEQEKAAGREAAVTEQDGHKTFDISVWPVRAGQDVRIRLRYIQPARIDTGVGRYLYPLQDGGVDEQKIAFWSTNDTVEGRFRFDLLLRSAYPVEAVRLPQHPQAQISNPDPNTWRVQIGDTALKPADGLDDDLPATSPAPGPSASVTVGLSAATRLDTDIAVYWRHSAGLPGRVDLVTYKPDAQQQGTFMLTLTPGDDLPSITRARDWVLVLDKSGSMRGKFGTLVHGVTQGLKRLTPQDRVRILLFDEQVSELTSGFVPVTPENVTQIAGALKQVSADNSTDLFAGLSAGLDDLDADRTSAVVLITDGVANVGETTHRRFIELARQKDVRIFTAIMGNSANRPLLDGIVRASHGTAISVSNSDDVVGMLMNLGSKVSHEALRGATLKLTRASGDVDLGEITPSDLYSVYRGEQLIVFGHYQGSGEVAVELTGRIGENEKHYSGRFALPVTTDRNPEIERLWAFSQIAGLLQENEDYGETADRKQAVTDLATAYGLVTPYTSMLVVREEVFKALNIARINAARVQREATAAQSRASAPVQATRADQSQPVFQAPQANYSGGRSGGGGASALGPWELAGGLLFVALLLARRRRHGSRG